VLILQLKWTDKALQQFEEAIVYIAEENPIGVQRVAQSVADATELLLFTPSIGHVGRIVNTQEWVVRKTPYIIAYAIDGEELWVLRLIASKQDPARLLEH
jgi:toxin ParE1/3/4